MSAIGYLRKNKWTFSSLGLVAVGLAILLQMNYRLAIRYMSSRGKARALFGIQEWFVLDRKILAALLLILGLAFLIGGFEEKENPRLGLVSLGLYLAAFFILWTRFWIWMVWLA